MRIINIEIYVKFASGFTKDGWSMAGCTLRQITKIHEKINL